VIWTWAIGRAGNLDGGRVVVRCATSTGRITIRDEADGVHRRRGLRLSAEGKLKNGTRMHKKGPVLLLVEAVTGKRLKQWIFHGNVDGLQTMRVKISAWYVHSRSRQFDRLTMLQAHRARMDDMEAERM
jgi:hypothetical protein